MNEAGENPAVKTLDNLERVLYESRWAIIHLEECRKNRAKLEEQLRNLTSAKEQVTGELRLAKLKLSGYVEKFGDVIEICPVCGGGGAFPTDVDEVGNWCGEEECEMCKGKGVVDARKVIVKCITCGIEFNLFKAKWCKHEPTHTKVCPNGHCICEFYKEHQEKFRPANEIEQGFGFSFMLDEKEGGVGKNGNKM